MATDYGKRFEFISGEVCVKEILEHGKSFGDAYLITEALEKSMLQKTVSISTKSPEEYFSKIQSKYVKQSINTEMNSLYILGWAGV